MSQQTGDDRDAAELPIVVAPGARLAGRFELVSLLGMGPHGSWYEARDLESQKLVAVKLMAAPGPRARASLATRARTPAGAEPGVLAVGEHADYSFVVTERIGLPSLAAILAGPALSAARAESLLAALTEALAELHAAGRVHANLKPSNVFVDAERVLLADSLEAIRETRHGRSMACLLGSSGPYAAPECLLHEPATTESDVFSLGVIGHELLTGRYPFSAPSPAGVARRLMDGDAGAPRAGEARLETRPAAALEQALDPSPERRPRDATRFAQLLSSGKLTRARRPRPGRHAAGLMLALLLGLGLGFGFATASRSRARSAAPAASLPATELGLVEAFEREGRFDRALEGCLLVLESSSARDAGRVDCQARLEHLLKAASSRGPLGADLRERARALGVETEPPPAAAGSDPKAPDPLGEARARYSQGDAAAALAGLEAAVRASPEDAGLAAGLEELRERQRVDERNRLRREANLALTSGDYQAALRLFEELLRVDPEDGLAATRVQELSSLLGTLRAPEPSVAPLTSPPAESGESGSDPLAAALAALASRDLIRAGERLAEAVDQGAEIERDLAARVFFNASVLTTRLGECDRARRFADRAARYDDPERSLSNGRWRQKLLGAADCTDARFQALVEGLALK